MAEMQQTVRILGTPRRFSPLPRRPVIVNKPVWLAVGLSSDGVAGREFDTYPLLTSEHGRNSRGLVALQNEADLGRLAPGAGALEMSALKSTEGDAHTTAGLLKMPVLLICSIHDDHITGWLEDVQTYL